MTGASSTLHLSQAELYECNADLNRFLLAFIQPLHNYVLKTKPDSKLFTHDIKISNKFNSSEVVLFKTFTMAAKKYSIIRYCVWLCNTNNRLLRPGSVTIMKMGRPEQHPLCTCLWVKFMTATKTFGACHQVFIQPVNSFVTSRNPYFKI